MIHLTVRLTLHGTVGCGSLMSQHVFTWLTLLFVGGVHIHIYLYTYTYIYSLPLFVV